ncbi:Asparaginase/glutaminase [Coccomyxa subellipsoidea C-169]|uniref:asparaginase n=1 Tax=Coccomyxa subellipsoidea (strain C-169) TaxID=574566 RepID=I0Z3P6_COCSC|nr:Asparaginase/glutaminase [Coccomyxa subellipsoidea C-169]EIE25265.1 Asparaginase/glutaminase [Coccomyxa subellipsoidea C-169]|eukprot:XP_005649809.1 Asparaginase/glutaminase [Coccomyxa subellipsoidea C-169]
MLLSLLAVPLLMVSRPLPRVLCLHTGGTLGMDAEQSYEPDGVDGHVHLKPGTGGSFSPAGALRPGAMLNNLLSAVPELRAYANLRLEIPFNLDSCRVGPPEWVKLAKILHRNRDHYDAFLIVHGTDTMAYTASALSLLLAGFKKPIVMTGSQLPLSMPRSDARQNLIDSVTCATSFFAPPHTQLQEVAICFGGRLMRGNRAQKVHSSTYRAFDSINYPPLATLGVDVDWNMSYLLKVKGVYRPRFNLDTRVIRVPIIPGCDPRTAYGDLKARNVRGVVLESFGVGNMPDLPRLGWLPWLKKTVKQGIKVYLSSQCASGPLHPELYKSGKAAMDMGVEAGPQMTPEAAVIKLMLCLAYPDIPLGVPIAGEL